MKKGAKAGAPILRSHNKLTDLPAAALLQLPNLKTLKLAGNPLVRRNAVAVRKTILFENIQRF